MNKKKFGGKKFERKKVRLFRRFELFSARTFFLIPFRNKHFFFIFGQKDDSWYPSLELKEKIFWHPKLRFFGNIWCFCNSAIEFGCVFLKTVKFTRNFPKRVIKTKNNKAISALSWGLGLGLGWAWQQEYSIPCITTCLWYQLSPLSALLCRLS